MTSKRAEYIYSFHFKTKSHLWHLRIILGSKPEKFKNIETWKKWYSYKKCVFSLQWEYIRKALMDGKIAFQIRTTDFQIRTTKKCFLARTSWCTIVWYCLMYIFGSPPSFIFNSTYNNTLLKSAHHNGY